ncbi:hypothetical protein BIWAKO_05521 [Bosea sp. BIWAKO-01]|nr:hypothetical protein BIWAKO_05521 [Bosea sp. BIWAKO-01]
MSFRRRERRHSRSSHPAHCPFIASYFCDPGRCSLPRAGMTRRPGTSPAVSQTATT